MHDSFPLILTLAGGLAMALAFGYTTHWLRLSPIVGYLLAGVAVGPHTPGFTADRALAEQMAELGVILLMFGVGLHFHLKELLAVRRIAIPGAVGQILFATALGVGAAGWLGWGLTAGLVFGLAISVASTVVLVRVLSDNHELHTRTGHIAVGWLVVEDLFTVVVLVILPALFGGAALAEAAHGHEAGGSLWISLLLAGLKIGLLIAFTFIIGGRFIPWLLGQIAETGSRELFTLTVLVVALGIAVGSARIFGVSMALGAFLAGMVVGRSEFSLRAATDALPMKDAFAVLFFVSVGMLFDPGQVLESPFALAATLGIVVLGKPLAALGIVVLLGYPLHTALAVAVALAQIGEFSFILASMGLALGVLPEQANHALIGAAILSISINPLVYKLVRPANAWLMRSEWVCRNFGSASGGVSAVEADSGGKASDPLHRAVVVGYGPVGRTVSRLMQENGIRVSVIEMNLDTVRKLRDQGVNAVYGDASHIETLRAAGAEQSGTLVLSASNLRDREEIIRTAHELNPHIRVMARSDYLGELGGLVRVGAAEVFTDEGEVALSMTESMLRDLGATADQIDRERSRIRDELFGQATRGEADAATADRVEPART